MFDPSWIGHFSRCHCVAICAALVPLNLLVSALVIGLVARDIAPRWRRLLALGGLPLGGLLVAHVASWWVVGVVALPTIILPTLALVCTGLNWYCLTYPQGPQRLWRQFRIQDSWGL